jgi:minor extracellular serine protease Vpr
MQRLLPVSRRSLLVARSALIVALLALVAGQALAETSKLDPRARIALAQLQSGAEPSTLRANALSVTDEGQLDVFITGEISREELEGLGVIVRTALPGIYTAYVPVSVVDPLAARNDVSTIRGAALCEQYLDTSVPTTGASLLRGAAPAFTGLNGAGVLVGDVDTGIDVHHDDFKDAGGLSRILYVWDQNNTTSVVPPSGYTYGHEWLKASIDGGTCTEVDGGALASGYGHGSHVMGIAAGDGSAGTTPYTYVGMAPMADIAMVATTMYDADILDGVAYIMGRATATGKNCVVNLSLGGQYGPHDGSSPFEAGLDALSGPGRVICVAAGNNQATSTTTYIHGGMEVPAAGDSMKFTITGGSTSGRGVEFNGWYSAPDNMTIKLRSPGNLIITLTPGQSYGTLSGTTGWPTNNTGVNGRVYMENALYTSSNGAREVYLLMQASGTSGAAVITGTWTIYCIPTSMAGSTSRFDIWKDYVSTSSLVAYFSLKQSNDHLTAEPSNARRVITVGAWETKNSWVSCNGGSTYSYTGPAPLGAMATFSSYGPSRDGYQKPDIAAPGMGIASVRSADATGTCSAYPYQLNDGAFHTINQGTSMAAPHVTGATALLFQKFGAWTPEQVKTYLNANATIDAFTGATWNNAFGNGKLHLGDLVDPVLAVTYPNGGETFITGNSVNVTWNATDNVGVTSVDVLLSRTGPGGPFVALASGIANSGSYLWAVGLPPSTNCWLKVVASDAAGNTGSDLDDAAFSIVDASTPTTLSRFTASPVTSGIELRWQFNDPESFSAVTVERAQGPAGPWAAVAVESRDEGGVSVALDRSAQSGSTYWYRIATTAGGTRLTFGPIEATAGEVIVDFALGRPLPNPTSGVATRVDFAVPRDSRVNLSLYDMQGRRVATLVEGVVPAGRHQATWNGTSGGRTAPAGIYFVRMQAPGVNLTRRLVVTR